MKLIIVSSEFPPSRIANARRPALLAREMHACGYPVEVITREPVHSVSAGPLEWNDEPGIVVHRIPDPVVVWRGKWGRIRIVRAVLNRIWPDDQLFWVFRAACCLRKMKGPATVVASILPVSMILLRWLVPSRRFYFVYDYLESVTPFRRQVPHDSVLHRQLAGLLARIERSALSRADRVVFTCSENRATYISDGLCAAERSVYIPQYCDPNPYADTNVPCDGNMIISYVGYFNRDRSPEVFLSGLRAFFDREPDAAHRTVVNCYGNGLGIHPHLVSVLHLEGIVNDCGTLDYDEILPVSAGSHILLLVASPKHRLFFPSKVSEYIAARRPVLALVPPESEITEALRQSGRGDWICPDDDAGAVADCLSKAWRMFQAGELGRPLPVCEKTVPAHFNSVWKTVLGLDQPD